MLKEKTSPLFICIEMKSKEGIIDLKPKIKRVTFEQAGKMSVWLEDGRKIITPLKFPPSIQKLSPAQRKKDVITPPLAFATYTDTLRVFKVKAV